MQQEVQGVEVGQLVPLDWAGDHAFEVPGYARCRHVFHEDRIVLRFQRDQPDVGRISLVAGPCVGELEQWHTPLSVRLLHTRSEEHTSELQSHSDLVCRLLLEKKKKTENQYTKLTQRIR